MSVLLTLSVSEGCIDAEAVQEFVSVKMSVYVMRESVALVVKVKVLDSVLVDVFV